MSVHLYCVLPRRAGTTIPADLQGVDGAPVRAIDAGGMVLWVSDVAHQGPVTIDGVKAHDGVVEAALEAGSTPVPARFGQRFANDDACRAAVAARAESLTDLLAAMDGMVEMTLILTPSTRQMIREIQPVLPELAAAAEPGAGTRYMERLRARESGNAAVRGALDALGRRLADATEGFIRRSAVHEQMTRMPFRTISHLVSREVVEQYSAAARSVMPSGDLRFLVVGPRAPYSFCAFGALGAGGATHGMKLAD
jgi:hypothetical protein